MNSLVALLWCLEQERPISGLVKLGYSSLAIARSINDALGKDFIQFDVNNGWVMTEKGKAHLKEGQKSGPWKKPKPRIGTPKIQIDVPYIPGPKVISKLRN